MNRTSKAQNQCCCISGVSHCSNDYLQNYEDNEMGERDE